MALYEFYCEACQNRFEQITSETDPERGTCPKCKGKNSRKLISKFAVGGRGDLRESTEYHGCHPAIATGCDGPCKSGDGHDHD